MFKKSDLFNLFVLWSIHKADTDCVLFPLRRKRKVWVKRRRRQSDIKSTLKTLPKEDDSDDACEKMLTLSLFLSLCFDPSN